MEQVPTNNSEATKKAVVHTLTPTEQLMYSTVRITDHPQQPTRWGTGFLFSFFKVKQSLIICIITNKHVVSGFSRLCFNLHVYNNGVPDINNFITFDIQNPKYFEHPDADLVAIPISPFLNDAISKGQKPYFITLDQNLIPTVGELNRFMPVEQVLTVGYPGQLWDDVHSLPVFHRGYTATAPYIEFKGRKEFLIDIATWPGASGSPVLVYNEGSWIDRNGNTLMGGVRARLVGVVFGVGVQDVQGQVQIQMAPIQRLAPGVMAVPTNLGACIWADKILDFEPLMVSQGIIPPPGYKMRSNLQIAQISLNVV